MASFEDPCALTTELAELAFTNYGETTENRKKLLDQLKTRLEALPEEDRLHDLSDQNLIRFLRCRKFDLERTVKMATDAKHFYDKNAEVLGGLNGKESIMFDNNYDNFFQIYRNVDSTGKVVAVLRPSRLIAAASTDIGVKVLGESPNALLRILIWLFHNLSLDPSVQVGGLVMLTSFNECSFFDCVSFVNIMTVSHRAILIQHLQICGIKMKGMRIFEEPQIASALFFVLKQFMTEKLRDRISFCGYEYGKVKEVVEGDLVGLPLLFGGSFDDTKATPSNSRGSWGAVDKSSSSYVFGF